MNSQDGFERGERAGASDKGARSWYEYEDERSSTLSPECRVTRHDTTAHPTFSPGPFPSFSPSPSPHVICFRPDFFFQLGAIEPSKSGRGRSWGNRCRANRSTPRIRKYHIASQPIMTCNIHTLPHTRRLELRTRPRVTEPIEGKPSPLVPKRRYGVASMA
jgi:hypothetical protein